MVTEEEYGTMSIFVFNCLYGTSTWTADDRTVVLLCKQHDINTTKTPDKVAENMKDMKVQHQKTQSSHPYISRHGNTKDNGAHIVKDVIRSSLSHKIDKNMTMQVDRIMQWAEATESERQAHGETKM